MRSVTCWTGPWAIVVAAAALLLALPGSGLALPGSGLALEGGPIQGPSQGDTLTTQVLAEIPDQLRDPEHRGAALQAIRTMGEESYGEEATLWVHLLAVAEKGSGDGGALAAEVTLLALNEGGDPAVEHLDEGLDGIEEEDRPALLALGARILDRDDPERAAELRRQLLSLDPEAQEAHEARLRLARHIAQTTEADGRGEAVELLEELIVRAPNHPLAPEARRLLTAVRR